MKRTLFVILLLFSSLAYSSDIPSSLAEADSISEAYFNWFLAATGYWPLFYNGCPKSPTWEGFGGMTIEPNKMRKNLYEQGFDTTLSDFYHYKAFMDTLYPLDSSIVPDTVVFYPGGLKYTFYIQSESLKFVWDKIYDELIYNFNFKGRLRGLSWDDGYSDWHIGWDNRGNPTYSAFWAGPSGDGGSIQREYDESNNLRSVRYSYTNGFPGYWLRKFDENHNITAEIVGNESITYSKTFDYDGDGNTKRTDIIFEKVNEGAKSDTVFTKTVFYDLTMSKMNPDSGFGVDSVKTQGDESILNDYKGFIDNWPEW